MATYRFWPTADDPSPLTISSIDQTQSPDLTPTLTEFCKKSTGGRGYPSHLRGCTIAPSPGVAIQSLKKVRTKSCSEIKSAKPKVRDLSDGSFPLTPQPQKCRSRTVAKCSAFPPQAWAPIPKSSGPTAPSMARDRE